MNIWAECAMTAANLSNIITSKSNSKYEPFVVFDRYQTSLEFQYEDVW